MQHLHEATQPTSVEAQPGVLRKHDPCPEHSDPMSLTRGQGIRVLVPTPGVEAPDDALGGFWSQLWPDIPVPLQSQWGPEGPTMQLPAPHFTLEQAVTCYTVASACNLMMQYK